MIREWFPCSHHYGGSTHGYAVKDDLSTGILTDDPMYPVYNIQAVMPAHSHISALAFSMSPGIGQEKMKTLSVKCKGFLMKQQTRVVIAMYQNGPAICILGGSFLCAQVSVEF